MFRKILLSFASIAVMSMALAQPADAQILSPTATSGSNSSSGATSNSGSNSGAGAAAVTGPTQAGSMVTFNSGNNSPYSNNAPNDITVRSAPQVYVPSVITGNVCALGASAGASFIGTGFALGATWESMSCEDRQRIALLHNMGSKIAAKEYACAADKRYYDAMKYEAQPCAVRPAWEPKYATTQPVPAPMPTPVVYTPPPAPKVYPRCNPRAGIVDNCIS